MAVFGDLRRRGLIAPPSKDVVADLIDRLVQRQSESSIVVSIEHDVKAETAVINLMSTPSFS
jgi:hypothetical protein